MTSEPQLGGGPGLDAGGAREVTSPLRPAITRTMLTVFVIGDVLGAGIYELVGEVAAGVGGAIWSSFLFARILASSPPRPNAELVTKYPQAAGAALYVNRAFRNPFFTFVVVRGHVVGAGVRGHACDGVSAATTCRGFVELPQVLVGLVFIAAISLINIRGIRESGSLNLGLTTIEVLGLALVVVIGSRVLVRRRRRSGPRLRVQVRRVGVLWRSWPAPQWPSSR
jgi:basic amino acid/polyamine antiporter, APA family